MMSEACQILCPSTLCVHVIVNTYAHVQESIPPRDDIYPEKQG